MRVARETCTWTIERPPGGKKKRLRTTDLNTTLSPGGAGMFASSISLLKYLFYPKLRTKNNFVMTHELYLGSSLVFEVEPVSTKIKRH